MEMVAGRRGQVDLTAAPAAISEVSHRSSVEVEAECARVAGAHFSETFMTAASPGIVASVMENCHYSTVEAYLKALSDALAVEYRYIVEHGLLLQIDAPDLALERHQRFGDRPLADFLAWTELAVGAINDSLAGIEPGRVRLHVCWGNYEGPHTHDVPLEALLPILYQARVGGLVLSMANPRHAHEASCFERRPPPDDWVLVAGVIDTTTNYVEHPEVVADRLARISHLLGDRRRIIAGTDCGFDTSAGIGDIAPSVAWAKLRALKAGADLATSRLF
jgi:5-methyltetrahydropteroyltriglutamate--homocysteine methyltransferase